MKLRRLKTGNISSLSALEGSEDWLWGTDYTYGDLYEAQELYQDHHRIVSNRLIFVNRIDGRVYEPVEEKPGQYFGKPISDENLIMILTADFTAGVIRILSFDPQSGRIESVCEIARTQIKDCYNLMMHKEPLMLTRAESECFEIIWPLSKRYSVSAHESFCFRMDDSLYFSRWEEDPDYREVTVIRDLSVGEIKEVINASLVMSDDGQWWMLERNEE